MLDCSCVPGNLFSVQKNFSFHTWSPWSGTVKLGCCSMLKSGKSGCNPGLQIPPCLLLMSPEESLAEEVQQLFAAPDKWEPRARYGVGRAS